MFLFYIQKQPKSIVTQDFMKHIIHYLFLFCFDGYWKHEKKLQEEIVQNLELTLF